jgi:ubiquinone/menaquinone biosynthesis C-methylase UbiE
MGGVTRLPYAEKKAWLDENVGEDKMLRRFIHRCWKDMDAVVLDHHEAMMEQERKKTKSKSKGGR